MVSPHQPPLAPPPPELPPPNPPKPPPPPPKPPPPKPPPPQLPPREPPPKLLNSSSQKMPRRGVAKTILMMTINTNIPPSEIPVEGRFEGVGGCSAPVS